MGTAEIVAIALAIITIIAGIIGYLLAQKDAAQEKDIFSIREEKKSLNNEFNVFRNQVFSEYVKRGEVEGKLERLETALFNKLDRIEAKLDGKADK